jgi:hypothetical protein
VLFVVEDYCLVACPPGITVLLLPIDLVLKELLVRHEGGAAFTVAGRDNSAYSQPQSRGEEAQMHPIGWPCDILTHPRVWLKSQLKLALLDLPDRKCSSREQFYDFLQRRSLPLEIFQFAQARRERYPLHD